MKECTRSKHRDHHSFGCTFERPSGDYEYQNAITGETATMTTKATTFLGKNIPKQSEEDETSRGNDRRKEEWVKTNKDRDLRKSGRERQAYEFAAGVDMIIVPLDLIFIVVVVVVVVVVVCGSIFLSFMWKAFALKRHFYSR